MAEKSKGTVRITLKSYDHKLIDQAALKIVDVVTKTGATVVGPVPLPTKREIFTVLSSLHVNKTSREQFERRTHKRLIVIEKIGQKTLPQLFQTDLPSGVDIALKQ